MSGNFNVIICALGNVKVFILIEVANIPCIEKAFKFVQVLLLIIFVIIPKREHEARGGRQFEENMSHLLRL